MFEKVISLEGAFIIILALLLMQIITFFFFYYYFSFLIKMPKISFLINLGVVDYYEHRGIRFFKKMNIKKIKIISIISISSCAGLILFIQINLLLFLISSVIFLISLMMITSWIAFKVIIQDNE